MRVYSSFMKGENINILLYGTMPSLEYTAEKSVIKAIELMKEELKIKRANIIIYEYDFNFKFSLDYDEIFENTLNQELNMKVALELTISTEREGEEVD